MTLTTRAQQDLKRALECVKTLEHEPEKVRTIYGGLCHQFPILVHTAGLCQAVAFSEDKQTVTPGKKKVPRNLAHERLLEHVSQILSLESQPLVKVLSDVDVMAYMHYTRRVLEAWVYFKRFAVSVLKVEDAGEVQDDAGTTE